jgi:hypothetical protein
VVTGIVRPSRVHAPWRRIGPSTVTLKASDVEAGSALVDDEHAASSGRRRRKRFIPKPMYLAAVVLPATNGRRLVTNWNESTVGSSESP